MLLLIYLKFRFFFSSKFWNDLIVYLDRRTIFLIHHNDVNTGRNQHPRCILSMLTAKKPLWTTFGHRKTEELSWIVGFKTNSIRDLITFSSHLGDCIDEILGNCSVNCEQYETGVVVIDYSECSSLVWGGEHVIGTFVIGMNIGSICFLTWVSLLGSRYECLNLYCMNYYFWMESLEFEF